MKAIISDQIMFLISILVLYVVLNVWLEDEIPIKDYVSWYFITNMGYFVGVITGLSKDD